MNTLRAQLEQATRELALYRQFIEELEDYAFSNKFKTDTTMQVGDIHLRLGELALAITLADY